MSNPETQNPLPCPFCGGAADIRKGREPQMHCVVWEIACKRCNMSPGSPCVSAVGVSKKEVTGKWNTRASVNQRAELLDALGEATWKLSLLNGDFDYQGNAAYKISVEKTLTQARKALTKANALLKENL